MIIGSIVDGNPFVRVAILIPRLGTQASIDLLVDTGSQTTLLHPADVRRLQVVIARHFAGHSAATSRGVGGKHSVYIEPCDFYFRATDGNLEHLSVRARFARPTSNNTNLPSPLGLDVLRHFRTVFEPAAGLLTLEAR